MRRDQGGFNSAPPPSHNILSVGGVRNSNCFFERDYFSFGTFDSRSTAAADQFKHIFLLCIQSDRVQVNLIKIMDRMSKKANNFFLKLFFF